VDTATPFLVWTIWPYAALDVSSAVLPFFIRRRPNFRQMVLTMIIAMTVCIAFWALMPTTYIRPPVPMGDTASEHLYRFFLAIDQPINCFPSGHIAAPGVLLVFVAREHPRVARLLWGVFALAAVSVLTTKQHYLWDILASTALVWLCVKLSKRLLQRAR
jgi:membrane-associated phospholipid phosphatase